MFTALQPLLKQGDLTIHLSSNPDGILTVVVLSPEGKGALAQPLALVATAADLDAEFATCVASFAAKRSTLNEQLEAAELVMEARGKEAINNASNPQTKSTESSENETHTDVDPDDDDQQDSSESKSSGPSTAVTAKPAAEPQNSIADLF